MNDVLVYKTYDHPEADGRKPQYGEQEWTLKFELDDGRVLKVRMGRIGRQAIRTILDAEDREDERV